MRIRYILLLGVFMLFSLFLPHIVETLYNTSFPLIIWHYTQIDILNYMSAVLGIFIALVALFLAIDANQVRLNFDVSSFVDDDKDLCFMIRIINESNIFCSVEQFGFSSMYKPIKKRIFGHVFLFPRLRGQKKMHTSETTPFELAPNKHYDITIKYKKAKRIIEQVYDENEKIVLYVSFANWKHYYKTVDEIRNLISDNFS